MRKESERDKTEDEIFRMRFKARLEHLIELLDHNAPGIMLVKAFELADSALIGIAPERYFQSKRDAAYKKVRSDNGFCQECGYDMGADKDYINTMILCRNCQAREEDLFKEFDLALQESEEDTDLIKRKA